MVNGHRDTITEGIIRFRDLLVAALEEGRDLEEVIAKLNKVIARRREQEEADG